MGPLQHVGCSGLVNRLISCIGRSTSKFFEVLPSKQSKWGVPIKRQDKGGARSERADSELQLAGAAILVLSRKEEHAQGILHRGLIERMTLRVDECSTQGNN